MLLRTITADGSVSVRVRVATRLVRAAACRHETAPDATVTPGRALIGAPLLASEAQAGERGQLQVLVAAANGHFDVAGVATGAAGIRGDRARWLEIACAAAERRAGRPAGCHFLHGNEMADCA